jgi:hypothetical protein
MPLLNIPAEMGVSEHGRVSTPCDSLANWVGLFSDKPALDSKTFRDMGTDIIQSR